VKVNFQAIFAAREQYLTFPQGHALVEYETMTEALTAHQASGPILFLPGLAPQ